MKLHMLYITQIFDIASASITPEIKHKTTGAAEHGSGDYLKKQSWVQQRMELPKEQHRQVKLTMTPTATSGRLTQEKPNSVTRLLAAKVSFKILN